MKYKKLSEQVLVVVGASSGIADPDRPDALWEPNPGSGREHGDYPGHVMQSSLYTRAALNPGIALIVLSMLGLTTALATKYRSANRSDWSGSTGWDV